MSLYALGDLHLHFQVQLKAQRQLTDPVWQGHEERFRRWCEALLRPEDTLVLLGDHSFGRKLAECEKDLDYIHALPGKKILLRGNHDSFWDAKKTVQLQEKLGDELLLLQNNAFLYRDYALVGTKGFTFEGPFYLNRQGRIIDWDREKEAEADRLIEREAERLRLSFEAGKKLGARKFILFLHYPPTNIREKSSVFTRLAQEYGAEQVVYAHCHGQSRFHDSLLGMHGGIRYSLVSGDFLNWKPCKILD